MINTNISDLVEDTVASSEAKAVLKILLPANLGSSKMKHEALMFIKPEIFETTSQASLNNSLKMIYSKVVNSGASIDGVVNIKGEFLKMNGIMDRHYGFINMMSKRASELLSNEEKSHIAQMLDVNIESVKILGGHEFMADHHKYSAQSLDNRWKQQPAIKIRSGLYVNFFTEANTIVVNGFHPAQLEHYTRSDHQIVLIVIHSNASWGELKNDLIGNTFPEKAKADSIRGLLFAKPEDYGFEKVGIVNNCVHLSAGPIEAMAEFDNFFKHIKSQFVISNLLLAKQMKAMGLNTIQISKILKNPKFEDAGKMTDLFTKTEEMDAENAIELIKDLDLV